jgi:hypothetical protein
MVDFGRQMDAAAINWTPLVIDQLNPSSSIWPTIAHVIASARVKSVWVAVARARTRRIKFPIRR